MDLHVTNICYFDTGVKKRFSVITNTNIFIYYIPSKRVFSRQLRVAEAIQKVRSVLQ